MTSKVQPAENYWTDDVKMTSKVQPAADYWTVDRENLETRLCYIWWAEKQRAQWRNSFKKEEIFWMNNKMPHTWIWVRGQAAIVTWQRSTPFLTFSFTSLLFRSFRLFRFGRFVSLFRVLVHAFQRRSITTLMTTEKRLRMYSKETSVLSSTLMVLFLIETLWTSGK